MERFTSKTTIRESLQKAGLSGLGQPRSARSYRRFFEGYIEEYVLKESGKGTKLVRTYTGVYYVPDQKARKWGVTKLLYFCLFALATALFIFAATRDIQLTVFGVPYMLAILPQPVCVIFLLWCLVAFVNLLMAPPKMTIGEYRRSSESLRTGTKCYALALALAAVGQLGQLFFCRSDCVTTVLFCVQALLLAAVLIFAIYRMEVQQVYHEQPNPNAARISGK